MNNEFTIFEENSIYSYIQNHEYLISPLSAISIGALTGGKIGGLRGAAFGGIAGGIFGITDQILINYKITSKHYLTSGVLGTGIMNSLQIPYYIGEIAGFAIGLITAAGYLSYLSNAVPTIMTSAIVTQFTREKYPNSPALYGTVTGAFISLIDETLIHFNTTNKHYLSTTTTVAVTFDFMVPKFNNIIGWGTSFFKPVQTLHNSITNFFNNIPYASLAAGVILGSYATNKTEINPLGWKPITLGKNLIETYERVLNKKDLEKRMELFAIASITNQLLFHNMLLIENGAAQTIITKVQIFGGDLKPADRLENWISVQKNLLSHSFFVIPPYILTQYIKNIINEYFSIQTNYLIERSINSEWLNNTTALKLSNSKSATTLIHHKTSDVSIMAGYGSALIAEAFSKIIAGFMSLSYITNNHATDILIYSLLYNTITSKISQVTAEKINEHSNAIRVLEALRDNLEKDISNKIKTITERGGVQNHLDKITNINLQLIRVNNEKQQWDTLYNQWLTAKSLFNNEVFSYSTIAYKLSKKELNLIDFYRILETIDGILLSISFETDNNIKITQIEKATESINELIDSMRNDTLATTEQYTREHKKGEPAITFENFTVSIQDGKNLVHLDNLKLTNGTYAIMGSKGSGKSSFTSKVIGLEHDGISAAGTITFSTLDGGPPKITSIPQIDHMPLNRPLLELFIYPQTLPKKQEELDSLSTTIQEYWKRINPTEVSLMKRLHEVDSWESILSGGQKKAVFIISAILQNTTILVLDETFNGLDAYSRQLAQDMIKKELPSEAIILSIDHHAMGNDNGFYDIYLNLTDGTFKEVAPSLILVE